MDSISLPAGIPSSPRPRAALTHSARACESAPELLAGCDAAGFSLTAQAGLLRCGVDDGECSIAHVGVYICECAEERSQGWLAGWLASSCSTLRGPASRFHLSSSSGQPHITTNSTAMLLRNVFLRASVASPFASTSSSSLLQPWASLLLAPPQQQHQQQIRTRTSLTPRRTKYRKAHKGRVPIHTGGSTAGTTLEHGEYGIRVKEAVRLSAKQLHSASEALRRGIKPIKGARLYTRVFPDIPVCIKVGPAQP